MNQQRWRVFFSGRVQGVGFRYQTHTLARRYEVTGWVANLPNGQVELLAEGDSAELERFVQEIQQMMASNIRSVEMQKGRAVQEFQQFEIRH